MALNRGTFKTRSLTAAIFVVVMLAGLLISHWTLFILFSVIHFGCWIEFQKIMGRIDPAYASVSRFHKIGVMIMGWCLMLYMSGPYPYGPGLSLAGNGLGLALLLALIIETLVSKNKKYLLHSFFGLLYISLSLALFTALAHDAPALMYVDPGVKNYWLRYACHLPAGHDGAAVLHVGQPL